MRSEGERFESRFGKRPDLRFHISSLRTDCENTLSPEKIREGVREGLEQGFDTREPNIRFYRYLKEFLKESETLFPENAKRIIAHPGRPAGELKTEGKALVLAIGPEGGYVESEIRAFAEAGFEPLSFGTHILRVEFAAAFITGFLMGGGSR